jgi:hypothetical protein
MARLTDFHRQQTTTLSSVYTSHRQHDEGTKSKIKKQNDKRNFIPGSPSIDARLDLDAEGSASIWETSFSRSLMLKVTKVFAAKDNGKAKSVSKQNAR